ncbi:hypothetical protein [Chitinophaga sp. MM2321]|uniref:hypothetical protein n=1 Tax=Chitinophaga sp. MM2321 TaxID=3137178 RepID=UPI0032D5692C
MKPFSLLPVFICTLLACNGQQKSNAEKVKNDIQTTMKEHTPGTVATSASGYYMKAKIDGKDWVAVSMRPIEGINRALGYTEDGGYIGIPGITKKSQEGLKLTLGGEYGADIYLPNDKTLIDKDGNVILLDKESGAVAITKRDGEWIEGTFHFIAASSKSDKKVQITEGSFRIK